MKYLLFVCFNKFDYLCQRFTGKWEGFRKNAFFRRCNQEVILWNLKQN